MISKRSTWLALAAVLTVLNSSCLFSHHAEHGYAPAVKVEGDAYRSSAPAVHAASEEPEYFEGSVAPEIPAALEETRPPAPSSLHVWVAGHHTRHAGEWSWVAGHYAVPPRADVVFVPGHWVSHLHGYVWIGGAWR